ncbi:sugar phosphate isomerase/epimerase family protein [Staphylococcus equorum]|uniref:sugar phosphate isomerase/epimerase family protein n=1 Tax=Staphylococcus equorum TaxID=246432 RepID=UPI002DB58BC0|nr:sugar phosphate isomerase/epimerase family protein [Staphylococcus equorum]MEB7722069.1 sugar phosphate isomerase/epimerase [Staphylococcus equorum]
MKFSTRLNSFKNKPELFFESEEIVNTVSLIKRMAEVEGLTHVELNYPEHFQKNTVSEIKEALEKHHLDVSGVALRFSEIYDDGEFTNPNETIRNKAITTTKEAIETCEELGGSTTTIWLANDGFDYSFQVDYEIAWDKTVSALHEIGEQYPNMNISFEYKPYQPRSFALVGDIGLTLLLLDDVNLPNFGVTLDFCHMLMKKENPAYSLALAAKKNRLMGFHLNDGYKDNDDGLMLGSVHLSQTIEFIYYAIKYKYDGLIYFDTFPIREDPVKECEKNIKMYKKIENIIHSYGLENIESLIHSKDATETQEFLYSLLS